MPTKSPQNKSGSTAGSGDGANGKALPTFDAALASWRAGLSLVAVARDGPKRPDGRLLPEVSRDNGEVVRSWDPYKERLPSEVELREWFARPDPPGIGVVGGKVSGNLEQLDF